MFGAGALPGGNLDRGVYTSGGMVRDAYGENWGNFS